MLDNLNANKRKYLRWISEIDRVVQEIAVSGTSSATLSASGGSKSYTHLDLDALQSLRTTYARRVADINFALSRGVHATRIRHIQVTRC